MINFERQSVLARLLAKENLTVRHGNFSTAFFDVENRVLGLPMWKDRGKDVYDLLVGHEVGHALYTPADGWHDSEKEIPGVPRAYLNVVEDIRIERKIQLKYPGLVGSFKRGYKLLDNLDFFQISNKDVKTLRLMDRINLKAKLRDLISVEFSAEEQPLVDEAFAVETWEDVLIICRKLYEFVKENEVNKKEEDMTYGDNESEVQDGLEAQGTDGTGDNNQNNESDSESESDMQSMPTESSDEESGSNSNDGKEEVSIKSAGDMASEVATDSAFRSNEGSLNDDSTKQPTVLYTLTKQQTKNSIYTIDKLFKARTNHYNERMESGWVSQRMLDDNEEKFREFQNDSKKFVNLMAKEFEMRKAAYQYSRAQTARSGTINVDKLHNYKFSDDIFKRITNLADAKSHGMVMFIDNSASMQDIIGDVIQQTLILSSFCKKVNIPFDVYSFTSKRYQYTYEDDTKHYEDENSIIEPEVGQIDNRGTKILHLLSSSFNKATFDRAYRDLFNNSYEFKAKHYVDKIFRCPLEAMNGTPLIETALSADIILDEFKAKHNIQRVNAIFLTDGDAQGIQANTKTYDMATDYQRIKLIMNKGYIDASGHRDLSEKVINHLRKKHVVIGYFMAARNYDFKYALEKVLCDNITNSYLSNEDLNKHRKEYSKNRFVSFDNAIGYDRFFIIKADKKSLKSNEDEFQVGCHAKKGEITRAFKKHANSKKSNRIFATKFAEMVA